LTGEDPVEELLFAERHLVETDAERQAGPVIEQLLHRDAPPVGRRRREELAERVVEPQLPGLDQLVDRDLGEVLDAEPMGTTVDTENAARAPALAKP
jgi:hypothetical protein